MTILVATGLRREAMLIERAGLVAIPGGGDGERLERALMERASEARAILSIGLAGALDPRLTAGDCVVGPLAGGGDGAFAAALARAIEGAVNGPVVGMDAPVATIADKARLGATSGALAVDMESHIAARVAARFALPFAAIRAISDDAEHTLPPAALVGMRPDGGVALGAVLASLARRPAQLPALLRTARDAGRAFAALGRALDALEALGIGRLDPRQFTLDMG